MPIVHIVLFEFKPTTDSVVIRDVSLTSPTNDRGAGAGSPILMLNEVRLAAGNVLIDGYC